MARVKNITDDVLEVPSLGLFGVQPGEIVEVPRASDFDGSEMWQVTATGTAKKRKATPAENDDVTTDDTASADEETSL